MGSFTDCLGMMPGALSSILWRVSDWMGPLPSISFPRGSTTRPSMPSPMGTSTMDPVLLTISPSWISLRNRKVHGLDSSNATTSLRSLYLPIVTQDDNTDVVSLEVEGHALNAGLELNHLSGLDLGESEDTGDTITDGDDGSELLEVILRTIEAVSTQRILSLAAGPCWAHLPLVAAKKFRRDLAAARGAAGSGPVASGWTEYLPPG